MIGLGISNIENNKFIFNSLAREKIFLRRMRQHSPEMRNEMKLAIRLCVSEREGSQQLAQSERRVNSN